MSTSTRVVSANMLYTMGRSDARRGLDQVLAEAPDLVGLQEWYVSRLDLLNASGTVRAAPGVPRDLPLPRSGPARYHWVSAVACGNVVGARADRFHLLEARSVLLSGFGKSDRPDRSFGIEPPRLVALGVYADRLVDRTVALISYHLTPGVERHGAYIDERPLLRARHLHEIARLEAVIEECRRAGHVVYAVGDSNFDLQRLAGLTSSWEGREGGRGTIGSRTRKLDDIHGPGPANQVRLLDTPSDHRAVIADYASD